MTSSRRIRIFVSSPGDVQDEREQCGRVVEELNAVLGLLVVDREIRLELIRWETHTHPDLAGHPQGVVDEQLGTEFDLFIGMMWSRFGTPTWSAGSGTEHEFRAAHTGWRARRRPAHILFYFCEAPVDGPDEAQWAAVRAFRRELEQLGLVGVYDDRARFADKLRLDLVHVLGRMLRGTSAPAAVVLPANLAVARELVASVAAEYDRVRATMPGGSARTVRMEVIASTLRTMARSTFPLLAELTTASDSGGRRLAAACALQVVPDVRHVAWLARRFGGDQPFIAYHAGIALATAARELPAADLDAVSAALTEVEDLVSGLRPGTDRAAVAAVARQELDLRRSFGERG
ncbi:hypothetical protein [Saccharothrix sp. Mg75]|uniref:hypothetical protein n=1 Tax=Saccharothrix sp. Mg75 TaxID=3445357 RepID=UPI003EEF925C